MKRRELMKVAGLGMLAGTVRAQEPTGPYSLPTASFNKANQHVIPHWAFRVELPRPLVPRPTAIGTYEELMKSGAHPFGPGDTTPLGECFHGIAREWGETPPHWSRYGCDPKKIEWEAWKDKSKHFGAFKSHADAKKRIANWGGAGDGSLPIKCYKIPLVETFRRLYPPSAFDTRLYSYAGMVPGPTMKMRLGQPVVVRFENHLETETSIHLHGGHSPSHSDGFPSFYVLQGKARDYFYPNILPLYEATAGSGKYAPDIGEAQSTMWYHDHAMDATAYNASKGLSGVAPCFGEEELKLIHDGVLPGLRERSCFDPEIMGLKKTPGNSDPEGLEDPENPGFYRREKEPYYNPYDIPLVLQDRVFDKETGQIAYDSVGHNGYIGETMLVNGAAWPKLEVERRKYRFRILDGSNARVYRLRIMSAKNYYAAVEKGIDAITAGPNGVPPQPQNENDPIVVAARQSRYDAASETYLRIGKDSWLWSEALPLKSLVLMMANRADIVVDFEAMRTALKLAPGETGEFFLVNTMPQSDGRGPKLPIGDGGDPRVLPVPFEVAGLLNVPNVPLAESNRPVALMKFIVSPDPIKPGTDASIEAGTRLVKDEVRESPGQPKHRRIEDHEIKAVREFIFERGKGAWQINGRFYDPTITNAGPILDGAEEWVLRNGGGGWWHPIHIHLESHQLVSYEKDFAADAIIDRKDPPAPVRLGVLTDLVKAIPVPERNGLHDTQALGPNTVARIRMRHRTWNGPFVFHCHNLEHEDMRMMYNFEPVPEKTVPEDKLPNIVPTARTHGNDVTWRGGTGKGQFVGELAWEYPPIPETPVTDSGEDLIPSRPRTNPSP